MDFGGSTVLSGTSAKTTVGYTGRVTEIAGSSIKLIGNSNPKIISDYSITMTSSSGITLNSSSSGLTLQDSRASMSAGHYGANINIDDTYGIRIDNSNYASRNNALYLGPLNIASDDDKTITNRYSTDNDTGVYAPEPTYSSIYS